MPRQRLLPDAKEMVRLRDDEGMTHKQIAEEVNRRNRELGIYEEVSDKAVSVALYRAGETVRKNPRYEEELPWQLRSDRSRSDYWALNLRLWGRENAGHPMNYEETKSLERFKRKLAESQAVVHYDEDTDEFILAVPRPGIDTGLIRLTDGQIRRRKLGHLLHG